MIPAFLLRPMSVQRRSGGFYDKERGGQWTEGGKLEIVPFLGSLLPMSNKDLLLAAQGAYTVNQQKIYTNGFELRAGETVTASDGKEYRVFTELDHTHIHPLRRYIVEGKEGSEE
jgi:hypothetical protein